MSYDPHREVRRKRAFIQESIVKLIIIIFLALLLAAEFGYRGDLKGILEHINEDLVAPRPESLLPVPAIFSIFPFYKDSIIRFLGIGFLGWFIWFLTDWLDYTLKKNMRPGEEHGSASFNQNYDQMEHDYIMSPKILKAGITKLSTSEKRYQTVNASGGRKICKRRKFTKKEIAYCRLNSQIYSKRVALSLDTWLTQLNLNTIVFGGSGAGKSRFFAEPNLLQANTSFVVTDPSGELMMKVGYNLELHGYVIKCLNIEKMEESMRYNPFAYVKEDADIPVMVDAMISNIEGPKKGGSGDNKFWDETSRTLLIALCGYLFETQPIEKQNFTNVLRLMDMADVSDDREVAEDDLDKLFNDLELANPSSYAVSQWKVIKQAGTGKTAQNIMISTSAIFARFFRLEKIANLTYKDELHLEELGQRKCALFICTPQGDTTYNFLASELYTQLFDILYKQGEQNAKDKHTTSVAIDVPVRCIIDEAANVGVIPHLPEKVSTMRKYGISIALIYQNQSQVKALMKDDWETIVGNCDTMLFLGGIDASTVKTVSERLGKMTLNQKSMSMNYGRTGGGSSSIQSTGRELMSTNEIEQMPNDKCIVFIRSMKPFMDYKYPLEEHPNFKRSGDYDERYFYVPNWHIHLDKRLLSSLAVKRKGEDGYIPPERKEWVSDEEIESVARLQAAKRAKAEKQKDTEESATIKAGTEKDINKLSDKEKSRRKSLFETISKRMNVSVESLAQQYADMPEQEILMNMQIVGSYSADYEFDDDAFKVDDIVLVDVAEENSSREEIIEDE